MQTRGMRDRRPLQHRSLRAAAFAFSVSAFAGCVTVRPARPPGTTTVPSPGETTPGPTAPPPGVSADEQAAFNEAVSGIDMAQPEASRARLEGFLARYPRSAQRPRVAAHLARLSLAAGDVAGARARLARDTSEGSPDPLVGFAQGLLAARTGQAARALSLLAPFAEDGPPRDLPDQDEAKLALQAALADARVGTGDAMGALLAWETYARQGRESEQAFARERADELVARLSEEEAARLYAGVRTDFGRAALGLRAAAGLRTRGDASADRVAATAADIRRTLGFTTPTRGLGPGDPYRLGLLAPFSGSTALIGEVVLRGAMLAIGGGRGDGGRGYQIVARDAAPERGGERAASEVVREEAAVAVVGVGDRGAAGAAARDGVPVLLIDEAVPGPSSTAFQILHTPENRAAELARRALVLGARRFAVLAPETATGRRLSEAFVRAVAAGAGRVTAQATYPAGASAFSAPITRIRKAAFEAVFVADDASRLELIAPALASADLWPEPYGTPSAPPVPGAAPRRPILLLAPAAGLGPQLLRNAGRYVQGALLAPGFFADGEDPRTAGFVNQFRTLYGQDPGATDAYGYDAFRLLVAAIDRGAKSRSDLLRVMASDSFEGVTGAVKFGADHTRTDPPPVYMVSGDSIRALR
ncbi:MAG TPA: penicillin-binding protein activator [Polyangia bacterium]